MTASCFYRDKLIMWKYADVKNFNGKFSGKYRMLRHAVMCYIQWGHSDLSCDKYILQSVSARENDALYTDD